MVGASDDIKKAIEDFLKVAEAEFRSDGEGLHFVALPLAYNMTERWDEFVRRRLEGKGFRVIIVYFGKVLGGLELSEFLNKAFSEDDRPGEVEKAFVRAEVEVVRRAGEGSAPGVEYKGLFGLLIEFGELCGELDKNGGSIRNGFKGNGVGVSDQEAVDSLYVDLSYFYRAFIALRFGKGDDKFNPVCSIPDEIGRVDEIYCRLHGIERGEERLHSRGYEFLELPVAFKFKEYMELKKRVVDTLKRVRGDGCFGRMRLLLIDNTMEKMFEGDGPGPVLQMLEKLSLQGWFKLRMLGGALAEWDETKNCWKIKKPDEGESFLFDACLWRKDEKYWNVIFDEVMKSDLVLLDFFLGEGRSYVGTEFLGSFYDRFEGEIRSRFWWFITSSVQDAAMRYVESGLLRYHEKAVVGFGDDPVREGRWIIFVYKLLRFIESRARFIENRMEPVFRKLYGPCADKKERACEDRKAKACGWRCVLETLDQLRLVVDDFEESRQPWMQEYMRKLAEDELKKEGGGELGDWESIRDHFRLLEQVLGNFFWLSDVDWPVIQMQIEAFESQAGCKFGCDWIVEQLAERGVHYPWE